MRGTTISVMCSNLDHNIGDVFKFGPDPLTNPLSCPKVLAKLAYFVLLILEHLPSSFWQVTRTTTCIISDMSWHFYRIGSQTAVTCNLRLKKSQKTYNRENKYKGLVLWKQQKPSNGGRMGHIVQFRVLNPHQ